MLKFVIGKQDAPKDLEIEVWLEAVEGSVVLRGRRRGTEEIRNIFNIRGDGVGYRYHCVDKSLGLQLGDKGRIKLINDA